ncbi:MAG: Isoleucine-tRNA ligase [Parcubacteria group bacterium GW2011_GWA2_43_13]|nr:MAG: Isoleucine-tRNA ligase [Parcubacteria group bacterium GW2011_GWA2_43_13]HAZ16587.1 isoleucine--tRNA ligase [Candidatus Jacksonbacteria bacterium]
MTSMSIPNFPHIEKDILEYWKKHDIFSKTVHKDAPSGDFVFYEGPPTANGKPGIHHVLARAFKDVYPRFKTMQGYHVERKAGWDTHGLPVELQVEKKLNISGKQQIENIVPHDSRQSIIEFNKQCKESVWEYQHDFEVLTERMAYWLDMNTPYITYTNEYIESVWWVLGELWKKGFLYRGHKVMPYCARCGTALSSHELALGYKKIKEPSVYVTFPIKNIPVDWGIDQVECIAWTTTPWTLPGNVALAVNSTIEYALVTSIDQYYVLALSRVAGVFGKEPYKVEKTFLGKELIGIVYEPLYDMSALAQDTTFAYHVIGAEFVSTTDGSGIVHIAPAFGEDDYEVGIKENLPVFQTVDLAGAISADVPGKGLFAKDADSVITQDIQERSRLLRIEDYEHDYPFCWRCETPLLYYAKPSYFIAMTKVKDQLIANNKSVHWVPEYIRDGRMGEWLENVKDWALSRDRYWGTPLPIWVTKNGEETFLGLTRNQAEKKDAIREAIEHFRGKIAEKDYHRPYLDEVELSHPDTGEQMKRVPEVVDVWFDSGAMPFAQYHYPFQKYDANTRMYANDTNIAGRIPYPADYISEAIDQTRGWFYTLQAIATALGLESPYKNVITFAHVLDKHGKKMSKSKGNVVDPIALGDEFGFDTIRWYFYTVSQPGTPIRFDAEELKKVQRRMFIPLVNCLAFYQLYQVSGAGGQVSRLDPHHILDKWIIARLNETIDMVTSHLESYQVVTAAREIEKYMTDLSTGYIQLSRDRFREGNEESKEVLRYVLMEFAKLIAPFAPFIAEYVYRDIVGADSVHGVDWPSFSSDRDGVLVDMSRVWEIIDHALALRAEAKIKVRQPLSELVIADDISDDLRDIIADRVNVKKVTLKSEDAWPQGEGWIGQNHVIALSTVIDVSLRQEGYVRELTRQINALRKKKKLTINDSIVLEYSTDSDALRGVLALYAKDIKWAVIASDIVAGTGDEELDIDGENMSVRLTIKNKKHITKNT